MEYLLILMFLGFAIYNLRESKDKKIRIAIKPIYNIILVAAGSLYIILACKMGGRIESAVAAISAIFYLYTTTYCQGIGEGGFYVLLGNQLLEIFLLLILRI